MPQKRHKIKQHICRQKTSENGRFYTIWLQKAKFPILFETMLLLGAAFAFLQMGLKKLPLARNYPQIERIHKSTYRFLELVVAYSNAIVACTKLLWLTRQTTEGSEHWKVFDPATQCPHQGSHKCNSKNPQNSTKNPRFASKIPKSVVVQHKIGAPW